MGKGKNAGLKLKEFADDNFKFEEIGRQISKQVQKTVGNGEIACYKQFLLFSLCFQKACFPGASRGVVVWEWVKTEEFYLQGTATMKYFADKDEGQIHTLVQLPEKERKRNILTNRACKESKH